MVFYGLKKEFYQFDNDGTDLFKPTQYTYNMSTYYKQFANNPADLNWLLLVDDMVNNGDGSRSVTITYTKGTNLTQI